VRHRGRTLCTLQGAGGSSEAAGSGAGERS
jgi:hypothetical protein